MREARVVMGMGAPVGMLGAQTYQESACRLNRCSNRGACGLTQFIPDTMAFVEKLDPTLAQLARQSPRWAFRAQAVYMKHLFDQMQAIDACEKWAKALASYNQGSKWTTRAEMQLGPPLNRFWFGGIETINPGKLPRYYAETTEYVRSIVLRLEPQFATAGWTPAACH